MNIRGGLFLGLAALLLGTPGCGGGDCDNPNPAYDPMDPASEACLDESVSPAAPVGGGVVSDDEGITGGGTTAEEAEEGTLDEEGNEISGIPTGEGGGTGTGDTGGGTNPPGGGGGSDVNAGPIDGVSIDEASCVRFEPLGTKTGVPNQGTVAVAFSLVTCDGEGVFGLETDDLVIKENGDTLSSTESQSTLIEGVDIKKEVYVTILLDNSPSVAANGALNDAVEGAKLFATSLFENDSVNTFVSVAFFSKAFSIKQSFTNDSAKVFAAISSLEDDTTGSNTTNLYGAMLQALDISTLNQETRQESTNNGLLTVGELVVFTDGKDQAGLHSLGEIQNAVTNTNDGVTIISFGGEMAPDVLESLGKSGSYVADEPSELIGVFQKVADLLNSESIARYILAYCSPKLGGSHQLTLEVEGKEGSMAVNFDATDFNGDGPECSLAAINGACDGHACGGLWCGGCGPHGICLADQTCSCMDNVQGQNCETCASGWTGSDCSECTLGGDCPVLFKSFTEPENLDGQYTWRAELCGITLAGEVACFDNPQYDLQPLFIYNTKQPVRDVAWGPPPPFPFDPEAWKGRHAHWFLFDDGTLHCPTEDCPTGTYRAIDSAQTNGSQDGSDPYMGLLAVGTDGSLKMHQWRGMFPHEIEAGEAISSQWIEFAGGPYRTALFVSNHVIGHLLDGTLEYRFRWDLTSLTTGGPNALQGSYHTLLKTMYCGIRSDGALVFFWHLPPLSGGGSGSITVQPPLGRRFVEARRITYMQRDGCGLLDNGRLYCWDMYNGWFKSVAEDLNQQEPRFFRSIHTVGVDEGPLYGITPQGRITRILKNNLSSETLEPVDGTEFTFKRGDFEIVDPVVLDSNGNPIAGTDSGGTGPGSEDEGSSTNGSDGIDAWGTPCTPSLFGEEDTCPEPFVCMSFQGGFSDDAQCTQICPNGDADCAHADWICMAFGMGSDVCEPSSGNLNDEDIIVSPFCGPPEVIGNGISLIQGEYVPCP